jgi:hypothetical protein
VYGFQWRHFGAEYKDMHTDYNNQGVDQLKDCIQKIMSSPEDRRYISKYKQIIDYSVLINIDVWLSISIYIYTYMHICIYINVCICIYLYTHI